MPHANPALPTEPMQKLLLPELVALQRVLALVDNHVLPPRVQEEIPILGADGAVAAAYLLSRKGR